MGSKNSKNSSSALPQPPRRKTQDFLLVWLDADINESTRDFKNILARLKRVVASIEIYKDAEECIKFIKQVKDQKVFMIVSVAAGKNVVPAIHEWDQIDAIYVFCGNKPFNERWPKKFPKVKGVYTAIEPICEALEIVRQRAADNTISVSFQSADSDSLFMYSQLVKEAILQIDYDEAASLKEFAAFCRQQDDINEDEIKEVEKNYRKHKPIWWYTAPTFMYSMLNRGLRVFDVDILMKMGFFMSQLDRHIQELSREQHANPKGLNIIGQARFELYRGQGLSSENFEKLKKTKGGLMSFNNFLSASYNKNMSLQDFARPVAFITDTVGILFIMQIDSDLCKKAKIPFVEITGDIGYFNDKEAEILFTTHTLFKIEEVQQITDPHTDRLYQVNLTVASPDTHELKEVTDSLNKEIGSDKGFSRLAYILLKCGLSEQAKDIYHALLEKATTGDDITGINYQLGWVYDTLSEYDKAIHYYELVLEYDKKKFGPCDVSLVGTYNNMGIIYRKMEDYSKALSFFEQALEIQKRVLPPNHPDVATSYNNLGNTYNEMHDYSKALSWYQRSLEIRKQVLPPNHPDLADSYGNIGWLKDKMGDRSAALSWYEKALEIRKQVLHPNHPVLAANYNNIGVLYENTKENAKAMSYYEKSLQIRRAVLPEGHPETKRTLANMERLKRNT